MKKQIFLSLLIVAFFNFIMGCSVTKTERITPDKLKFTKEIIEGVVTVNLDVIVFNKDGATYISQSRKITGITPDNDHVSIELDSVLYLNVKRTDAAGTILATVGGIMLGLIAIGAVIALTKQSCPFIYSYDGNKYVFDAEPLGGATTKGLERTEYSRMDYLNKVDSSYKILVRNEVEETQHLDELSLLAIKHDKDKDVIPDLSGNFYQIKNPLTPISATDGKRLDLKRIVSANDNLYWQSKLPVDNNLISENQRQELTFTFLKPKDKTKAKLIANIGTSLWGSRMIREMLQLYGNSVDEYYEKINEQGSSYEQLMNFIETEELYKLKYYTKTGDNWTFQGFINGGGPLISETRVYDLDLSKIKSDTVIIKMNPPYGFWTVDYLAVQYDEYNPPVAETMPLKSAVNQDGTDLKELIKATDNKYYSMPNVGDYFEGVYSAVKSSDESKITYYLKSSGYYELHLDKSASINFDILAKFITDPGFIVKYSNNKYRQWEESNKEGVK